MGCWGNSAFANDVALDWAVDLVESDDLSIIEAAIDAVLRADGPLNTQLGEQAVAACDMLARLIALWGECSDPLDQWVATHKIEPSAELLDRAAKAIDRVVGHESQLRAEWDASETGPSAWLYEVAHVREQLRSLPETHDGSSEERAAFEEAKAELEQVERDLLPYT